MTEKIVVIVLTLVVASLFSLAMFFGETGHIYACGFISVLDICCFCIWILFVMENIDENFSIY